MHPSRLISALCFASCFIATAAVAQATAATDAGSSSAEATTNDSGPAGIVPYNKGYNLSIGTTSQHDSSDGWSSLLTPDAAYRFSRHFSADFSLPLYTYINVLVTSGTKLKPIYTAATKHGVLADSSLNGHYETSFGDLLDYNTTLTAGFPTGNSAYGLGAGKFTYNFNNHFEKSISFFTPDIEIGIGDSSQLQGERIRRAYTTVGELAHFQAGAGFDLPYKMNFNAEAFEELPISGQTVYSTTGRGKKKKTTATNTGAAEDNGFLSTLDIPLQRHITLSGFYNRSLRNHIDTGGFSLTFLLKGPPQNVE